MRAQGFQRIDPLLSSIDHCALIVYYTEILTSYDITVGLAVIYFVLQLRSPHSMCCPAPNKGALAIPNALIHVTTM